MYSDVTIIIPARIDSTRLPGKPLATIGDQTMIEHVVSRIKKIGIASVVTATDSDEIAALIQKRDFDTVITSKDCPSGTDRVYEAFKQLPYRDKIKYIINVQGDMPFIDGTVITKMVEKLQNTDFDIMTCATSVNEDIAASTANVKLVTDANDKAIYFSRSPIPYGAKKFLYHIGIYGFKVKALEKFVALPQSPNEMTEKLEQLRALDNNMTIGVCYSNEVPISVDTEADLQKAREFYKRLG